MYLFLEKLFENCQERMMAININKPYERISYVNNKLPILTSSACKINNRDRHYRNPANEIIIIREYIIVILTKY